MGEGGQRVKKMIKILKRNRIKQRGLCDSQVPKGRNQANTNHFLRKRRMTQRVEPSRTIPGEQTWAPVNTHSSALELGELHPAEFQNCDGPGTVASPSEWSVYGGAAVPVSFTRQIRGGR